MEINVDKHPAQSKLQELGLANWSIWTKEISEFPWHYDRQETCYFLEGEVIVVPESGQPQPMGKGDLVIFPAGMSCTWKVLKAVKKHYRFD
jgi:uncharacterized protein